MRDLTSKEAADRLGVTPVSVTRWAVAGLIPGARKIGRQWRLPAEAIERIHREGITLDQPEETEA